MGGEQIGAGTFRRRRDRPGVMFPVGVPLPGGCGVRKECLVDLARFFGTAARPSRKTKDATF